MANQRATTHDADQLSRAIHSCTDYAHVTVEARRGYLYVYADDEDAVARLSPLGGGQYGLSFHHHTGRWEKTPFTGDLVCLAGVLTNEFGSHLQRWDFHSGMSGSSH